MELKARLFSLENQINSLQSLLSNPSRSPQNFHDENYNSHNNNFNFGSENDGRSLDKSQDNLRNILMKLKMEHQMVLQNIEKALELVDSKTPERISASTGTDTGNNLQSSPLRLREKINSVLLNGSSPSSSSPKPRFSHNPPMINGSSPLSPAVEKSHITFDILNELENRTPPMKRKAVHFHFREEEEMMSMASKEYLKKYGLI